MRVPLHKIRLGPNVPAGLNPLVVMSLAYRMRGTLWEPDPILVRKRGGAWQIMDGRHRVAAAWMAGRTHVDAKTV